MLRLVTRARKNALKIVTLWTLCAFAHGQDAAPSETGATGSSAIATAQPPPSDRHWRLGAALGYGQRSNPLIQSEDIPVIVDLDIAWFGKRWFFDNGDIGFTLYDQTRHTTSLVARLNSDRVFFGKTNTRYVNFAYTGNGAFAPLPPTTTGGAPVSLPVEVEPPDRDYAIEVGVESLIDVGWGSATLRAFHDVSGTHGGYELSVDLSRRWTVGRLSFAPMLGVAYKSERLNDYYWGVSEAEASIALPAYHAGGGFAFEGGVLANYYVTPNLRVALSFNYEQLPDDVAASPLAEDDHVFAYFSGLAWTF